jgi:4-aminobutyrate aminotransferase-like enzyme
MTEKTKSLELWERDGDYLLMAMPYADGLIAKAEGCKLWDIDGNEMLDLAAGQFCSIVGHNHPRLVEKVVDQIRRVVHLGTQYLSPVVLEAAAKFAKVAPSPSLKKSLLFSTGTEANECALSIAKMYTGKTGVAGLSRGYYGLSLATKSVTSIFGHKHGSSPKVPESHSIMAPHCFHCPVQSHYPECDFLCLKASIENQLGDLTGLAAIIVEPIVSAGGMFVPPAGYFKALKEVAREHEALLIVDEAQTGFGRTGRWFGIQHHEVEPDILVVSKGAGGGFPVSALITTDEIARQVNRQGFSHLASHQSDPIAAAAIAAVIDIVRDEGLVEQAETNGRYFRDALLGLKAKHSVVTDVRGQGLMLGMELVSPHANELPDQFSARVVALAESKGVHVTYSYYEGVLRFIPPLTLSQQDIDTACRVLDESIGEAMKIEGYPSDLLPRNRFTREFVNHQSGRKTFRNVASRLYETSPRFWLKKIAAELGKG